MPETPNTNPLNHKKVAMSIVTEIAENGEGSAAAEHPAVEFLTLLGKDPSKTWCRTIQRGRGANLSRCGKDLHGFDAAALQRDNHASSIYFVSGNANTATGKNKKGNPTGCVCDEDVVDCSALFVEWDDLSIDRQLEAWKELALPEPSVMVLTGGKSVHCYWVLSTPLSRERWREITGRLIEHCNSDIKCCNPSRVMRLPGFAYIDKKTGKPNGQLAEIAYRSEQRYSAAEIEACLLPPQEAKSPNAHQSDDRFPPRTLEEIREAAAFIPVKVVDSGDAALYEKCRRALSGCAAALEMVGESDDVALDLLEDKWPDRATAAQVLGSTSTRCAGSFWGIASEYGHKLWPQLRNDQQDRATAPETEEDRERAQDAARRHQENASTTLELADVLHPWLAERLKRRAASFPLDPLWLLGPGLATCAALIGSKAQIEVKSSWAEPFVLWVGNVADASTLKSSASGVWKRPLIRIELEERRRQQELYQANKEDGEKQGKKEEIKFRRFVVADATYESVIEMAEYNPGLISYQDELSGWFANLERQCSASARSGWLSLWGGDAIIKDRSSTRSVFVPKSAVSLFGNVQPDKLAAMMASTGDGAETAGDGLWSRFLWVRPPYVPFEYVEADEVVSGDMHRLLERLYQTPVSLGNESVTTLRLTRQAKDTMAPFWKAWADEERDSAPGRRAFLGKLRGYSVRLAGLLALIDAACDSLIEKVPLLDYFAAEYLDNGDRYVMKVNGLHAGRAIQLALFFLSQFDALQNTLGHGDLPPNVAKLITRAREAEGEPVTTRVVGRWKLPRRDCSSSEVLKWLTDVVVGRYGIGRMVQGNRRDSWVWEP
jgi:hypothetical protein